MVTEPFPLLNLKSSGKQTTTHINYQGTLIIKTSANAAHCMAFILVCLRLFTSPINSASCSLLCNPRSSCRKRGDVGGIGGADNAWCAVSGVNPACASPPTEPGWAAVLAMGRRMHRGAACACRAPVAECAGVLLHPVSAASGFGSTAFWRRQHCAIRARGD